jgi:hypothetical protein
MCSLKYRFGRWYSMPAKNSLARSPVCTNKMVGI